MSSKQTVLQKMLADDLDSGFLKMFSGRMPVIYEESISRSVKDSDYVDDALKPYYFGQTRYTLVQSLFLSVGRECGHKAIVVKCEQNGFPIPVVKIGRFYFTTHYNSEPQDMSVINASLVRKQNSVINDELVQPKLFGSTFNEERLVAAENIYANIIFGCQAKGLDWTTYGFLRIAVPYIKKVNNKDKLYYAENHDYNEVLQMVVEKEKQTKQQKPMVNVAAPKLKVSRLT
jgi:hypothetical protein